MQDKIVSISYKALINVLRHGLRFANPGIPMQDWIECMGFLLGNVNGDTVNINDVIPMTHGNEVEVKFSIEHYAKADEINQKLSDEFWIVGWYHTHPGHGLFLSSIDKINHAGYQISNKDAIALVFDPSKIKKGANFSDYIRIFQLKDPEDLQKSTFQEITNIGVRASHDDVVQTIFNIAQLHTRKYPLIFEYKERNNKKDE